MSRVAILAGGEVEVEGGEEEVGEEGEEEPGGVLEEEEGEGEVVEVDASMDRRSHIQK